MITQIDADDALKSIVESLLDVFSGKDGKALYIHLDVRGDNYKYAIWKGERVLREQAEAEAGELCKALPEGLDEEEYPWPTDCEASAQVHFLVFRPTNYTQVYAVVDDSWKTPEIDQWALQSDHDSCWKTDGFSVLNEVWFSLRDKTTPKNDLEGFRHHCFIHKVERVTVETERGTDTWGPGRRRVVSFKKGWPS